MSKENQTLTTDQKPQLTHLEVTETTLHPNQNISNAEDAAVYAYPSPASFYLVSLQAQPGFGFTTSL